MSRKSTDRILISLSVLAFGAGGSASAAQNSSDPRQAPSEIRVTVSPGRTLTCRFSHQGQNDSSHHYLCPDEKHPVIVSGNQGLWHAVGINESQEPAFFAVRNVETPQGQALHQGYGAMPDPPAAKDEFERYQAFSQITHLLGSFKAQDSAPWPPAHRELYEKLLTQAQAKSEQILKRFAASNEVSVELEDGKKLKCVRGKDSKLVLEARAKPGAPQPAPCEVFSCDPIVVDGVTYEPLLYQYAEPAIFSSDGMAEPGPHLTLSAKDRLGPSLKIKQVTPAGDPGFALHRNSEPVSPIERFKNHYSQYNPIPQGLDVPSSFYGFTDPMYRRKRKGHELACESEEIQRRLKQESQAYENLRDAIESEKIAILLDELEDAPQGRNVLLKDVPENYCRLEGDLFVPKSKAADFSSFRLETELQALTPEQAGALFKDLAAMKEIPYGFIENGCESRAHVMADRIRKRGHPVRKTWAYGGNLSPYPEFDTFWQYHVAPSIPVKTPDGKTEWMILDPSLADHPLTAENWLARFTPPSRSTPIHSPWPIPQSALFSTRTTLAFSDADVYLPVSTALAEDPEEMTDSISEASRRNQENLGASESLEKAYREGRLKRPAFRVDRSAP